MATQSPDDYLREQDEKNRLIAVLGNIANSADAGLYYRSQMSLSDIKKKLKDINEMSNIK